MIAAVVALAVVALALLAGSAQAGPSNSLCTRYNVGQILAWPDGHWYRCRVYYTGNAGQYPHYGWIDLGIPASAEV